MAIDKKIVNLEDLKAGLQFFYDELYPVNGDPIIGFNHPNVPKSVTATWTDISSTYEGRYFKVSSSSAAGTSEAEQLPNISGTIGCLRNISVKTGAFSGSYSSTDWPVCADGGYPTGQHGYNVGVFNAAVYNPVYTEGGAVKPLTTTIKVWKRTA